MVGIAGLGQGDFAGCWRLVRAIADRRAGETGQFAGKAEFRAEGPGRLCYRETGWLVLGDRAPLRAERRYLWLFGREGVEVCFADGRPFHRIPGDAAEARHDCPPDLYRVRYDFAAWPEWRAIWEVSGPRKDYRLESRYRRDASG